MPDYKLPITINRAAERSPVCWRAPAKVVGTLLTLLNPSSPQNLVLPYVIIKLGLRNK